jgi:hypothetical protein
MPVRWYGLSLDYPPPESRWSSGSPKVRLLPPYPVPSYSGVVPSPVCGGSSLTAGWAPLSGAPAPAASRPTLLIIKS